MHRAQRSHPLRRGTPRRSGRGWPTMRGPDFEIPTDPPGPPADPPVTDVPRRLVPRRAVAVVALVGASAVGAVAWYSQTDTTPRRPAAVVTSAPTRATAEPGPARNSPTSTVTPTTRTRTVVRTCLDSQENPGASPTSSADWITFDVSPRVAGEALALISDAASEARQALGDSGAFTMHVHCDLNEYATALNTPVEEARLAIDRGRVAHVRRRDVWIYGPAFEMRALPDQRRTLYHEYFHVVQGFLSLDRSGRSDVNTPLWLLEGSARYFENAVRPGDLQSVRRTQIRRWDALPTLEQLEETGGSVATGGSGGAYTLGLVASDYLVTKYGRERLQHDFWVALAGTDWRSAFLEVFGVTVDAFYSEFEAYRATLRP